MKLFGIESTHGYLQYLIAGTAASKLAEWSVRALQALLPLFPMINHGTDFGGKFFLQALYYRILRCPAASGGEAIAGGVRRRESSFRGGTRHNFDSGA